jgi:hypothetical protein
MPPELQAFDHIHVRSQQGKALRWYAEVLGLRRSMELEFWAADGGPLTIQNPSGSAYRCSEVEEKKMSLCRVPTTAATNDDSDC